VATTGATTRLRRNGDQVGDLPYKSTSLYENLMDTYPELRLFQLSPATDAIDLAARAFPIFQPGPTWPTITR